MQPEKTNSPHKPGAAERMRKSEQNQVDARKERLESEGKLLRTVTASDLLKMEIAEPEILLAPWLRRGTLAMIAAQTGIGKTWTALSIAGALSTGGEVFGGLWNAPQPRRVLFVDGEMSLFDMKDRFEILGIDNRNALLCNPDLDRNAKGVNIASPEWQEKIELTIETEKVDVAIFDNVASLYRVDGNSNTTESWMIMQEFLWKLRRRQIGVIIIDHRGKSNGDSARGTSAKSDILDIAIMLKRPDDYQQTAGSQFIVRFTKSRGLFGDEVNPFLATLCDGEWEIEFCDDDGKPDTKHAGRPKKDENANQVRELFEKGIDSPTKIVEETNIPLPSVNRYLAECRKACADHQDSHPYDY